MIRISTPLQRKAQPASQRGFSLVELLISMVIGLLVLAGVVQIMVSNGAAFRTQEAIAQVQETGRYLSYVVNPYVRNAGYVPDALNALEPDLLFPAGLTAISGSEASAPAVPSGISSVDGTDTLTVRYFGQVDPVTGAIDNAMNNCMSQQVDATQIAESTFYISVGDDGVNNLSCRGRVLNAVGTATSNSTQPLLAGVQDLQILYGIDTGVDRQVDQFVTADAVADWTTVCAVRLQFVIDSTEQVAGDQTLDGAEAGRLRRQYETTVQIRNRLS